MKRLTLLALLVGPLLAAVPPRAEEVAPPVPETATVAASRARLATWREKARPPADVPATAIVRAAVRRGDKEGERSRQARRAPPSPAIEIIWHAPGWTP